MKKVRGFILLFIVLMLCVSCSKNTECDMCGEVRDCKKYDEWYLCNECSEMYKRVRDEHSLEEIREEMEKAKTNNKISIDLNNYDSLVAAVNIAIADINVYKEIKENDYLIRQTINGVEIVRNGAVVEEGNILTEELKKVLGSDFCSDMKLRVESEGVVKIERTGVVVREKTPHNM